jgi:hypothetical protein
MPSDFQTVYRQAESSDIRLAFDIEKLDSLLNLSPHGSPGIIGEQIYTQLLMDRLCVHSMLPRRHGEIGEGYSKIIAIDAGNCSDVYQIVNSSIWIRNKKSVAKHNRKQGFHSSGYGIKQNTSKGMELTKAIAALIISLLVV